MRKRIQKFTTLVFVLFGLTTYAQIFTFTNAGATGNLGPTQAQVNTAYTGTPLAGQVTVTAGIQYWTVPYTGQYIIEVQGAKGGGINGGLGASMIGEFSLTQGQVLKILVGQQGDGLSVGRNDYSGGGGSFVATNTNTALIVAGGGGGAQVSGQFTNATITTTANGASSGYSNGQPGSNGNGGTHINQTTDGGAGFLTNGTSGNPNPAPQSFLNGGQGGCNTWSTGCGAQGGFGGGGSSNRNDATYFGSGGGGGYSGGAASYGNAGDPPAAGGGASFNSGTNQINTAGVNSGHGIVIISRLSGIVPDDAAIISLDAPNDTVYCKTPTPIVVTLENNGTDSLKSAVIEWSVDGIIQAPYTFSGALDSVSGSGPITAQLTIGTFSFTQTGTHAVKVWSTLPNGVADTINFNDTIETNVEVQLFDVTILNQTNVSCNGGSNGSVLVNTIRPNTSYDWGGGITTPLRNNLSAGSYFVTVSDIHNCPDTFEVIITEPDPLGLQIVSGGYAICNGQNGSITVEGTGGTSPYNYLFMGAIPTNSLNNIVPGTFAIQITDANNCVFNDSVSIINPPILNAEIASIVPSGCNGNAGEATASANGGIPPYSYNWSDGSTGATVTGLIAGDYIVTITDSLGCEKTQIARVRSLDVSINNQSPMLIANNNSSGVTYQWINCETGQAVEGETGKNFMPTTPGNYAVIVSEGSCSDTSECVMVVNTFVSKLTSSDVVMNVYPNPSGGQFNIHLQGLSHENSLIEIIDLQGKILISRTIGKIQNESTTQFDINLANGIYFVKMQSGANIVVKRLVIQ